MARRRKRANGEGSLYPRKDGRWVVSIMDGVRDNGKPNIKYFYGKNQKEAVEKFKAWDRLYNSGLQVESNIKFKEWSDIWFEHHKDSITPTTQESYRYTLRVLQQYFGNRDLVSIKAFDIETFLKALRNDGKSDSYLTGCRGMLFQIFKKAEANDLVHKNPVQFAEKMRRTTPKNRKEAFTAEEVRLLMQHLPEDRVGISIRLMLGTGMRTQELLALQPKHIAADGSKIVVEQAVSLVKGTVVVGTPKSFDSYRCIPVPTSLRKYATMLRDTENDYVWEAGKKGQPCNPSHFRDQFKKAITNISGVRTLTPHSCRHTYVTMMHELGVDISTIQSIVGHADTEMTQHYLHVQESIREDAIARFSQAFGIE